MIIRSLMLFVLLCLLQLASSQTNNADGSAIAICEAASTCKECILADPSCSWCAQFNKTGVRCREQSVNEAECPEFLQNPRNKVTVTTDNPFSEVDENENLASTKVIQIKPQALNVKLRPGVTEKVNITFRRVVDYPLDLYYVMDLSFSMNDDLKTLQGLGSNLVEGVRQLTNNVRLGFGTFVDKVMLPFASTIPAQLENPCLNSENSTNCAPVFGFRHQLPLTSDGAAFIQAVLETNISGNIDSPEGGFDALMQIAVCKQIEWREVSLRVILYASDASPHIAMDGKLAAILDINDMKCHLEKNVHKFYPSSLIYAGSKTLDYPSIGQLKKAFQVEKIQPIFAVTEDVFPLYDKLRHLLNPAYADILASDSKNVISLISTSYNKIRSRVQLNNPELPPNIQVKHRVLCPDSTTWVDDQLECSNVVIGDEVTFQFELTATSCPDTPSTDTIHINSNSIQDTVAMSIDYVCECDCNANQIKNSPKCNSNGTLECGICSCNPGIGGQQCQCSQSSSNAPFEQNCTAGVYTKGASLCNSQGFCECGTCICNQGFSGKYCECRNTGCPENTNGEACGGPLRGTCLNCNNVPQCICRPGWTINRNSGQCSCSESLCKQNSSSVCYGNGECACDRCSCEPEYSGRYCETCINPRCLDVKGTCSEPVLERCASCLYRADRLNKEIVAECREVCLDKRILFKVVDTLPDFGKCVADFKNISTYCSNINVFVFKPIRCEVNPISTCVTEYTITWNNLLIQYEIFVKKYRESDCPAINPLTIVIPVVGGILLIGIIALIIWKIIQTIRDKHEYEKFITETNNPQWAKGKSNLYVDPNSRVQNPTFQGNDYTPVKQ